MVQARGLQRLGQAGNAGGVQQRIGLCGAGWEQDRRQRIRHRIRRDRAGAVADRLDAGDRIEIQKCATKGRVGRTAKGRLPEIIEPNVNQRRDTT